MRQPALPAALAVLLAVAVVAGGCGESKPDPAPQPTAVEDDSAARDAQAAVQRWIDGNDCSALSDEYVEEAFSGGGDPRTECEEDEIEGLRKGDYEVVSVEVRDDRATVEVKADDGEERRYTAVEQDGRWLVDDLSATQVAQSARMGEPLKHFDAYELNGDPLDVRFTITPLSIESRRAPEFTSTKAGRRWFALRVRVRSDSSGTADVSSSDFQAVTKGGQRYQGTGHPFEPTLGYEVSRLAPGDTLTGYVSLQVPKAQKVAEVRYTPAGSPDGAPLIWKVRAG